MENKERTLQCTAGLLRKLCAVMAGAMRPWDASGSCNEWRHICAKVSSLNDRKKITTTTFNNNSRKRPDLEDPANQIDGTGTLTWW